jgi:DNA ligase-1
MLRFAQTCEAIAATTKKLEKTALVSAYFKSVPPDQAAIAAIFLSGGPFAAYEQRTLQVGGALIWRAIADLSGKSESELSGIYRRVGDGGSVAAEALPNRKPESLSLADVRQMFDEIAAARGPAAKSQILHRLLGRALPLEAKYIVKIISGDLRIGLKESLVEEAIARTYEQPLDQVKRANMLLGDVGETLSLAAVGKLATAHMRLFHPIDFMLASPVESTEEALSYFENAAVEDKYDGIRAHAHVSSGEVRLFSRTRDEITHSFPELVSSLAAFPQEVILDGEILAWNANAPASRPEDVTGRALPFSTLQQRLGRKKVTDAMMRDVPVAYLVFDVLYAKGDLLLDRPLRDRASILNQLCGAVLCGADIPVRNLSQPATQSSFGFAENDFPPAPVLRAPVSFANTPEELEALFTAARARGNEGLMIKDLDSPYTPGRRGKSWLKMKRELATLDVVVTAVEYGHGKRIGVLSDYTFAVWDDDRLVNIGKAYSGLTDVEIAEMTKWFLEHVTRDEGLRLQVEPKIVLEVAFNNMMRSTRHESGFALRFPRIVRLRPDKPADEADTLETVREIYKRQEGVDATPGT